MDYYLGMIAVFGFNWAPLEYSTCQGQSLPIGQNTALYSLLGQFYGGSGQVSFNLPNLQGRTVIGQGVLTEASGTHQFQVAQQSGSTTNTLTTAQMPAHNHSATFTAGGGGSDVDIKVATSPGGQVAPTEGAYLAAPSAGMTQVKSYLAPADVGATVSLGGVTGGGGSGGTVTVGVTGSSAAFSVMQPYLVMNPCICVSGLYPSRP